MTRGKYAAKAANRNAAFDNQLLVEANAKLATAAQEIVELKAQVHRYKTADDSEVVSRADALAAQEIAGVRAQMAAMEEAHMLAKIGIADWLVVWVNDILEINSDAAVIPVDFDSRLAELVGNSRVGEYVSKMVFQDTGTDNRRRRRMTPKKIKKIYENNLQDMAANNEMPELVKGGRTSGMPVEMFKRPTGAL